jgi:glucose/arabinose dehydrogenase
MHFARPTLLSIALLSAVALAGAQTVHKGIDPKTLPAPDTANPANNGPKVIPQPEGVTPKVPAGFKVNLYAEGLNNPRWITVAPNGDVFVVESRANRVSVFRDADGDGKPEVKQTWATGFDAPFGIAFWKDYLYVANTGSVVRFPYKAGQLESSGPPETVVANVPAQGYRGHWTRDLVFNPSGSKMYLSVGSSVNVGEETDERRATILEFNPDGTGGRVYASGIRNAVGKAFHPRTGQMWCTVNERDGLGDDLVPDYFMSVKDGGFYGWPWYYAGSYHDPRVPERPDLKDKTITPELLLTSHVAALGLAFYNGRQFPRQYQGDAFVALHGSGNRTKRVGYSVVRIRFKDRKPTGEYEDFLTGFMLGEGRSEVWGRPVGVAVAKDGSLLVTDDGGNKVWRVSYGK